MTFEPYVAKERKFEEETFDFLIADITAKAWYDGSPNQFMSERAWCKRHLRKGDNVVDCGAHHGLMSTLFALWVGPQGSVTSYEALPSNARIIEKNALLNQLSNITVRPVGVGDAPDHVTVALNDGYGVGQGGLREQQVVVQGGLGEQPIELVRLDDDLPQGKTVNLVKIDVEGSELRALCGARQLLKQRPIVVLEVHNFLFSNREKTLASIFRILSPSIWTYEVLGEILSVEFHRFDGPIDVKWLAAFDNPHVFCVPRPESSLSKRLARTVLWAVDRLALRRTDTASHPMGQAQSATVGAIGADLPIWGTGKRAALEELICALYIAYFNRAPDVGGLQYWLDRYTTPPVHSPGEVNEFYNNIKRVAASFADPKQQELIALYPFLANPQAGDYADVVKFVTDAYGNLFNRRPAAEGLAYWATSIARYAGIPVPPADDGVIDRAHPVPAALALLTLILGADANDAAVLASKIAVGLHYRAQLLANNIKFTPASAREALVGVTGDPASVKQAETRIAPSAV
jgi:FkbM family methyltransferase